MIQSLDPVGSGLRLDPLFLQGRGPVIDAEQARLLGLRNGQVVQAVIDGSATAFQVMWPAGQRQGLPTALQAFPLPSQWRWAAGSHQELLAVLMPGGHIMLRPLKPGAAAQPGATGSASATAAGEPGAAPSAASSNAAGPAARAAAQGPGSKAPSPSLSSGSPPSTGVAVANPGSGYTLGQAFALALSPPSSGPGSSAEVARLLQQAPAWAGLLRVLHALSTDASDTEADRASGDDSTLPAPLGSRLADMLGGPLPRLRGLTPEALQQAMGRSGLGTEAALLAGALGLDQDLKVALRRLMRSLPASMASAEGGAAGLARGIDTLERSALDSLNAQMQGQLLFSMVVPFGDAGPVALRVARERRRPGEEPPPFVVDVHSAHSGLGPLWLRTQVASDQRVSLTMWAERSEVCDQARGRSQDLKQSLLSAGLRLSSLEIVNGMPDPEQGVFLSEESSR